MRTLTAYLACCGCLTLIFADSCVAADNHKISATPSITWKSEQGESKTEGQVPLIEKVRQGDTLEIRIPQGPHGFVTIQGEGNDDATEAPELVWACGQPETQVTKSAPLREIGCTGSSSNFGKLISSTESATMRFDVTQNFQGDLNFWCVKHTGIMWGKLEFTP
jgi:hypothetical protein